MRLLALTCLTLCATARAEAPSKPVPIFEYTASDGEFGLGLVLYADRTWTRLEHSGTAKPSGRLTVAAMTRFRELLGEAQFQMAPADCTAPHRRWWAVYRDPVGHREATRTCDSKIDVATERLPGALETLMDQ